METIGQVWKMSNTFEWDIHFSHLLEYGSTSYFSPSFEFANGTWYLQIDFNGHKCRWCIYLYLVRQRSLCSKHVISYKLSIKDKDGLDYKSCEGFNHEFVENGEKSIGLYEKVNKLRKANLAPKGFLTFSCMVSWKRCFAEAEGQKSCLYSEVVQKRIAALKAKQQTADPSGDTDCENSKILREILIHDLEDLFLNQKNCDCIIRVHEQEFPVHRTILAARSTVFAAMFEHDMAENCLDITDAEPDVFRSILLYMYCGKVEFSTENVFEFYILAERFDLDDLKQECVKFIRRSLSVVTICDVIVLADKYNQKQMKEFSIAFLTENMLNVLATVQWKKLEVENHLLAIEVMKSTLATVFEN